MNARRGQRAIGVFALVWLSCVVTSWRIDGADPSVGAPRAGEASAPDTQDLLFLGPIRPMIWRLHLAIDGQPFRAAWQKRFDRLFAEADVDRDGRVSPSEALSIVSEMNGSVRELAGEAKSNQPDALARLAVDAGIDRKSLANHVALVLPQFVVRPRAAVGRGSALALFPLLDVDGNHQLSREELSEVATRLRSRDFNDDGVITGAELILDPKALAAAANPASEPADLDAGDAAVMLLDSALPELAVERLLAHYDRDRDGRLALKSPKSEIKLSRALERACDANGDGSLDRVELARYLTQQNPDIELYMSFGQTSAADNRNRPRAADSAHRIRKTLLGGYDLRLGEAVIALKRSNYDPQELDPGRFRGLDRDNNEYLDPMEASQGGFGKGAFAAMDVDGDEKVFKAEFMNFMDRQDAAAAVRLQLEVIDLGQNLLDLLDTDQDGALSPREMQMATQVLETHDANGDGMLNGEEIPQMFEMEMSRGVDARPDPTNSLSGRATRSTTTAPTGGPLWFRKMDRNNDGDVDRREFVGPKTAFDALDANHDGLIDQDEAAAAENP